MKLTGLLFLTLIFISCTKSRLDTTQPEEACIEQKSNPAGLSYTDDALIDYDCNDKHCSIVPLSCKNYWVYEDSIFIDGIFSRIEKDTLTFSSAFKSATDNLVWWSPNKEIGLPPVFYSNDSSFYSLTPRMFTQGFNDVRKDYSLFIGDSVKYLANFQDLAAQGRSLKIKGSYKVPAGSFDNTYYFEKNSRFYRKDQVIFKPGIGVLKFIKEEVNPGERTMKMQQISTLISYYIR
jgi:hypothetical protein